MGEKITIFLVVVVVSPLWKNKNLVFFLLWTLYVTINETLRLFYFFFFGFFGGFLLSSNRLSLMVMNIFYVAVPLSLFSHSVRL